LEEGDGDVFVNTRSGAFLPMETAGTQHLVNRTYRESGPYQWARETYINAREAGATRVEFGLEWQAVESKGVYRRLIADNGSGMDPSQLVEFFNTYGGGGKPIGGIHENFGVGAKTSLLPWNTYGVVVVSWVDAIPAMIWIHQNPDTGEYGLKVERAADPDTGEATLEAVYAPYEDEDHGCDWEAIKPDWIEEHGTVIVLLGGSPTENTVLGDPSRDVERAAKGLSNYLNRRLWHVPTEVNLSVDELRSTEPAQWPSSEAVGHGPQPAGGPDRRTNRRRVLGAKYFIEYPNVNYRRGGLAASGTERLSSGTEIDWYLWEGRRPDVHAHAPETGFIAALYRNELYNVTAHHSTYRSFGIVEQSVRQNVWLIIRPPALDEDTKHGIYPRNDRNALLLRGGPHAGGELPLTDWGGEFADHYMPEPIKAAINASRSDMTGTLDDAQWRERLAERFGARWRIPKVRIAVNGKVSVDPSQRGTKARVTKVLTRRKDAKPRGGSGGRGGGANLGTRQGALFGDVKQVAGGIPRYRAVTASELGDGMLAAWAPHDPIHKEGVVLINIEHEVLRGQIAHWQAQYPDHWAEDIQNEVIDAYGQIAVAKVAHSEFLKGILPTKIVEDDLRSEAALTMSLLGLMAEGSILATRIGGKFKRKKAHA
jgi:hypothetical protein